MLRAPILFGLGGSLPRNTLDPVGIITAPIPTTPGDITTSNLTATTPPTSASVYVPSVTTMSAGKTLGMILVVVVIAFLVKEYM